MAGLGEGGESGQWQGWDSRLTWASAILAGTPEGKAADHLGQHAAQQHVQQDDSVALGQALADAARHQGYHVAHLGHSWCQYTLGWGRERVGWNLLFRDLLREGTSWAPCRHSLVPFGELLCCLQIRTLGIAASRGLARGSG